MSKIFVESYIANKNYRQGLYPHGLPPHTADKTRHRCRTAVATAQKPAID
jgi:hypothetical protein